MRLLLDTHVVLWQLSGERSLGVRARELIGASTELAFSVVSFVLPFVSLPRVVAVKSTGKAGYREIGSPKSWPTWKRS